MAPNDRTRAGAGGNWPRKNESVDSNVVRQTHDASCVAAAGEMLCRAHAFSVSQSEILTAIGEFANSKILAEYLNKRLPSAGGWLGGFVDGPGDKEAIRDLISSKLTILAILREGTAVGHAVLAGPLQVAEISISDPFDQSSYNMTFDDFIQFLSEVVFKK